MSNNEPTSLAQLQQSATLAPRNDVPMSLTTGGGFDQLQRVAKALCASTLVPVQYRAFAEVKERGKVTGYTPNPAGLPNCIVALNMATRMNADPLLVMQNLHIIEGRPSWSSPFIIAAINHCGRFSPLRFELSEPGELVEVSYQATEWIDNRKTEQTRKVKVRHQTCRAWVIEKETGERLDGPTVSIQMAIDEAWLTKKGSKWQTMPEVMLRYRAASLFGRLYAPELLMGLQSQEEAEDIAAHQAREIQGSRLEPVTVDDLRDREPQPPAILDEGEEIEEAPEAQAAPEKAKRTRKPKAEQVNTETGEITEAKGDVKVIDEQNQNDDTAPVSEETTEQPSLDNLSWE